MFEYLGNTAFISDIHGNAVSLEAVLQDIREQGCTRIFALGDIVNGPEPSRCIAILRGLENTVCIKGNAEFYVLTPNLESFPQRDSKFYPDLLRVIGWWLEHMSPADIETIRRWPDFLHLPGIIIARKTSPTPRFGYQR